MHGPYNIKFVTKSFALLGCYAAYFCKRLPTFRDNLSVPSSGVKQSKILEDVTYCCPETSVNNYK
jgi:hypothetical protein